MIQTKDELETLFAEASEKIKDLMAELLILNNEVLFMGEPAVVPKDLLNGKGDLVAFPVAMEE